MNQSTDILTIPPGLRELYESSGPILRFRILRDVLGRDESFLETANALERVYKLQSVLELINSYQPETPFDFVSSNLKVSLYQYNLRLCEYGLESSEAVKWCRERQLLSTLLLDLRKREYEASLSKSGGKNTSIRDSILHALCRSGYNDELVKTQLEIMLAEWNSFINNVEFIPPPTWPAFAAVCCYPWSIEDLPRVQQTVQHLFEKLEADSHVIFLHDDLATTSYLRLPTKEEYLARPSRFLFDLEMSARLGITQGLPVTRWLFEELEYRQDADGWIRFPECKDRNWYFPLEAKSEEDFHIEYTFRAAHIFKLLEYDF